MEVKLLGSKREQAREEREGRGRRETARQTAIKLRNYRVITTDTLSLELA